MIFIVTLHPRNANHLYQNKITIPIGVSFFQDVIFFIYLVGITRIYFFCQVIINVGWFF